MEGGVRNLLPVADYDGVGAGDILGVEPVVPSAGLLQGQLVVLDIVASDQNGEAVVGAVAFWGELWLLALLGGAALLAQVALLGKLGADGGQLVVGLGAGQRIKDRVDIDRLLLALLNQLPQLLFGGVCLAVFTVLFLGILRRGLARV